MAANRMPVYESIEARIDGSVGVVTLNRPEQLNTWDWIMGAEIGDAYDRMDRDDAVRAIVLTGAGRAFCAGAGLLPEGQNWNGQSRKAEAKERYPAPQRTGDQLRTPIIAAINGAAVGAGITMALNADIRIAAEDATIGFVFHRRGVIPDGDLLWSLPRQIGYAPAMDLLLTGRKITGAEAFRMGLVSRAVPQDRVLETAMEIAREIAENVAPLAAALTKLMARRLLEEPQRAAARALQDKVFAWSVRQSDAAEGVDAFMERRRPNWRLSANKDFPTDLFDDLRD